ncbi:MAG: amidohydrolase family protein [Acetobacteraceae bacterium]|nr:amidohydrolase family protein [Acetobacteraceae bacterium]
MTLVITDTVIVTGEPERHILDHAAIAIEADRIAAFGPTTEIERAFPDAERMPGRGLAVFPGFVNAHTHTPLTILRGTVEDWDGDAIYGYMSPVSYEMSGEERGIMAQLGCLEAMRAGCTTLVEPFRHLPSFGAAMAESGLRLWLSENCADINTLRIRQGDYSVDRAFGQAFLDRTEEMISLFHGAAGGRVRCQVAAHAPDNCSPWMLERLSELAAKHRLTRTIHLAQSMEEVRAVRAMHGATPAEYLDRQGFLGPDLVGAHWTFCTPDDIALLASRGVQMAHCPANSSRKGPHRVLIGLIRDAGVNIALGTDNMTEDMFHTLKIGQIIHRGGHGRANEGGVVPSPWDTLAMGTINGARSVGAEREIGSIAVGKKADLTFLDLATPSLRPIINLVSNVIHYGHPAAVHSVMVDGRFVMRDRRVLTLDEPALLRAAQEVTRRVWERMLTKNPDIPPPLGGLAWLDA